MRPVLLVLYLMPVLVAGQSLLFDRITTADGLPSDEVQALFEDRDGFIWAGTNDGLARLEGARIRVFHYDHNDSTSLAHDQVNGIAQDSAGRLWFATMDGLSQLDPRRGTFTSHRIVASGNNARLANRMQQVIALGDTLLWLVTEAGLYRHAIGSSRFEPMQGRPPGEGPSGKVNASGALFWDQERGTLWAGTHEGLASWSARTDKWTDHRNTIDEPWATISSTNIPVVRGDSLWFLRNKPYTLFTFDMERKALHPQSDIEDRPNLFTLRCQGFDANGGHWLCTWTHRVFHRRSGETWREVSVDGEAPGALPSAKVNSLLRTRSGAWWMATRAGIAALRPGTSATSLVPFTAGDDDISSLRVVGKDTLLIGTGGGGAYVLDLTTGKSTHHTWDRSGDVQGANEQANYIRSFGTRYKGGHLVCTGLGLARLDPRKSALTAMDGIEQAFPRARYSSFTLAEREDSVWWFGTWANGLWRSDERTGACERVDTVEGPYGRLPSRMILCWLSDSTGRHWVGLNDGGGLARMKDRKFHAVTDSKGAHMAGVVSALARGPDGRIWAGTNEQGIVVHDPATGNTRYLTRRDGLPGNRVQALAISRDGSVWAAVKGGFARTLPGSDAFQTLALPAGFPAEDASALVMLDDERIVLACGGHLLLHDPAVRTMAADISAVFTGYRVNDRYTFGAPAPLELPHDRKALTLELGTVGHHFGPPPRFRYRLTAEDTSWHELGTSARIDLFDLSPGGYMIDVQTSIDGVDWNARSARAHVTVMPPFYATWWFRAAIIAVIMFVLFIGFRIYVRERLRAQQEAFLREQAVLQERMRIASDMHDDLGAGLSALKLRSEMALRVEKDPVKREQIGTLAQTAGELIGSMRQIIWAMNADQGTLADLVTYTTNYARSYCSENGLVAKIDVPHTWPGIGLSAEQRRNVFLVVKEALHNTVKHANARTVRLRMALENGLTVTYEDDGVGLPLHAHDSVGNGLRNMRKRVDALGGAFEAGTGPMEGLKGARIHFSVPIANEGSIGTNGRSGDIRTA